MTQQHKAKLLEDIWNPETKTLLVYHAQLHKTFVRELVNLNKITSWFDVKGKSTFQYGFPGKPNYLIKILSADEIDLISAMVSSHDLIKTYLC